MRDLIGWISGAPLATLFRADVKDVGCISNLGPGREVTEPDESPRRVRVWCSLLMLPGVDPKIHFGFERASPFSARPLPPRAARSLFFFSLSLSLCRKHRRTSCLQAFVFSLVLAPWARAVAGRAPLRGGAAGALLGFNGEMLEDLEFLRCDLQVGKLYYG